MLTCPAAIFDCLFLGNRLQRYLKGFSVAELQLLAYLSCTLSIYRHNPQADWGYAFVGTEFGAPFSREIDSSARTLQDMAHFLPVCDRLNMTAAGQAFMDALCTQEMYADRIEYLNAASSSVLAFSVGMIREALAHEPELRQAKQLPANRSLLGEASLRELYEQFQILREALGSEQPDLRVPAVAWLMTLFQGSQQQPIFRND